VLRYSALAMSAAATNSEISQGQRLRRLRVAAGLTQWDLQAMTGINRTKLSLVECGHVCLTAREERTITSVLSAGLGQRLSEAVEALTEAASTPLKPQEGSSPDLEDALPQ
jgi:hypothetical protein